MTVKRGVCREEKQEEGWRGCEKKNRTKIHLIRLAVYVIYYRCLFGDVLFNDACKMLFFQ